jgi:hypothetical protein
MNQIIVLPKEDLRHSLVLPNGSLTSLTHFFGEENDSLYALVDSINEKENIFAYILYVFSLHSHSDFHMFLRHLIKVNKLQEKDMVSLYRLQPKETRLEGKFINLTLLLNIQESGENKKWIFSRDEFMALAQEFYDEICMTDIYTIFLLFFYRSSENFPFEKKFLLYHYKKAIHPHHDNYEGKLASLIAIATYNHFPEEVLLDDILKAAQSLAMYKPESHGIVRYLSLAHFKMKTLKERRLYADTLTKIILELSFRTGGYMMSEILIGSLLSRHTNITKGMRLRAVLKLREKLSSFSKNASKPFDDLLEVIK